MSEIDSSEKCLLARDSSAGSDWPMCGTSRTKFLTKVLRAASLVSARASELKVHARFRARGLVAPWHTKGTGVGAVEKRPQKRSEQKVPLRQGIGLSAMSCW